MDGGSSEGSEARFAAYVEALGVVPGHADRQQPMHDYCLALLMPIDRKSVEPNEFIDFSRLWHDGCVKAII